MRIAVLDRSRCQPKKCQQECIKFCPLVRTGVEAIVIASDGKPIISEELCEGCGICIKRCPFKAISIIGLPEELKGRETHRYGPNGFVLYGLPLPKPGRITGILGANGTGKSTAVKILAGILIPNLGRTEEAEAAAKNERAGNESVERERWMDVARHFAGTELQNYFERLARCAVKTAFKPQYVDAIPKIYSGEVKELLERVDERGIALEIARKLELEDVLRREISALSGGELQRVAVAACLSRDADFYFLDEITPYLDIYQRVKVAKVIRESVAEAEKEENAGRAVLVVEHDLAILDMLADTIHIFYGEPARYGVVTMPKGTNRGINEYLSGYLRAENVRIRDKPIEFVAHPPKAIERKEEEVIAEFTDFRKEWDGFCLISAEGRIYKNEILGIVGRNATGKSTFLKVIAGKTPPSAGKISLSAKISLKEQYLKRFDMPVREILERLEVGDFERVEVLEPLGVKEFAEKNVLDLSGGELQMLAVAVSLCQPAEIYALDEPSAHLDVEQKVRLVKVLRRFAEKKGVAMLIVDHDIYLIDLLSDRLMVFGGIPSVRGEIRGIFNMREGMNIFLKDLGITFRRDEKTKRPRVNKIGSAKDREQKERGEYYYS